MFSLNSFGLQFLSFFSVLTLLLILKILQLFSIFTFIGSVLLILWLSWILKNIWQDYCPKILVNPSGKAILITGCDSGFGLMTAQALHKTGFTVLASCLSNKSVGTQTLNQMNIKTFEMNVTNEEQIKNTRINVENYLKERKCVLWAVINNAGILTQGFSEWGDITDLKNVMDVNVIGLVMVTRHFLPLIRKCRGRVVNMSSCVGRYSFPTLGFYSMSKHSVIAFSDALRNEMLLWNVKVVTIEPMHYQTPMADSSRSLSNLLDLWRRTPPEIKSDYGENFFHSMKERILMGTKAARPQCSVVVNAMVDAVANINPKIRYTCCDKYMAIFWWAMEILPNELTDKVFSFYLLFVIKPRALDNGF